MMRLLTRIASIQRDVTFNSTFYRRFVFFLQCADPASEMILIIRFRAGLHPGDLSSPPLHLTLCRRRMKWQYEPGVCE